MPIVQVRNASMQELNSADALDVEHNNFAGSWIDAAGGTGFIGAITVPLATVRINSAPELYVMASNILRITEAGVYFFNFAVSAANSGSAEMIASMVLEQDPDTTVFASVPGTLTYNTWFNNNGSMVNSAIVSVKVDYRYRLVVSRIGGSVMPTLVANASYLSVFRLFKDGFM